MFHLVRATEWTVVQIDARRHKRLLTTSFESIVQRISSGAVVAGHRREKGKSKHLQDAHRAVIELRLPATIVDCFHNGAGGYRAQFYRSASNGEKANCYLILSVLDRLIALCRVQPKRGLPAEFIEASLRHPAAKVWIHQGRWLRCRRLADRKLHIQRWLSGLQNEDARVRDKLAVWAQLAPSSERMNSPHGRLARRRDEGNWTDQAWPKCRTPSIRFHLIKLREPRLRGCLQSQLPINDREMRGILFRAHRI